MQIHRSCWRQCLHAHQRITTRFSQSSASSLHFSSVTDIDYVRLPRTLPSLTARGPPFINVAADRRDFRLNTTVPPATLSADSTFIQFLNSSHRSELLYAVLQNVLMNHTTNLWRYEKGCTTVTEQVLPLEI